MSLIALARLLQLCSQALPIGGYSHSQGLEAAIEHGAVRDEASLLRWIADVLEFSMKSFEIPCMLFMGAAWSRRDPAAIEALNDEYLSARESAELRAAAAQMGYSLRELLYVLPDFPKDILETLRSTPEPSLPCVWSAATTAWDIRAMESVMGYLWAWAENQVLVAMKAVPLGQSAGQRVLLALGSKIVQVAADTDSLERDAVGFGDASSTGCSNFSPGLAILSSRHETQYSRLFRS